MNKSIVFTADVIKQLNNLPEAERNTVTTALVNQYLFGKEIDNDILTPMQSLIFCLLSTNVRRASANYTRNCRV